MVRNSKRRAFTIVELVIVIAVIAILAAVMIPTFGGVIESANVSADRQMLTGVNSQISIYIGTGNKIETEADLWEALKGEKTTGGTDYTERLNPKSASYGYHYWYNGAEQKVELLTYENITTPQEARFGKMTVRADSPARELSTHFAAASLRSLEEYNYFFLDKAGSKLAEFFDEVEVMSTDNGSYADAVSILSGIGGVDKDIANKVADKVKATAIVTDDGIFVNSQMATINYVYIPANVENKADYYLASAQKNENGNTEFDSTVVSLRALIVIPANVKLGDGALAIFGQVTASATIDFGGKTPEEIKNKVQEHISGGSVTGTITINGNTTATITPDKATVNGTDIALNFRNTVTDFTIGTAGDSNIVKHGNDYYIALDKINNAITLDFNADNFTASVADLPLYDKIVWTADNDKVTVDELGVVSFAQGFDADTVTFTGTAAAGGKANTFTVKVVRVSSINVKFESGKKSGTETLAVGGSYAPINFLFNYYDASSTATIGEVSNVKYGYQGATIDFDETELVKLAVTDPSIALIAKEGETKAYFTVSGATNDFALTPDATKIDVLTGSTDTQKVTVKVIDKAGDAFTADITVKVKDNTDTPFQVSEDLPTYKVNYTYIVGNDSVIPLKVFFEKKAAAIGTLGNFVVNAYDADEEDADGNLGNAQLTLTVNPNNWDESTIDFADDFIGEAIIEIKTEDNDDYYERVTVEVVDGVNIGASFATNNKFANASNSTANLVLHSDFTLGATDDDDGTQKVTLNNSKIYGNYFTVHAPTYVDTRVAANGTGNNMSNGYSLIQSNGTDEIRQLVIDGPVYESAPEADDQNGLFCFGLLIDNASNGGPVKTVKVVDSYLSGFMAPVRLVALNTTLELTNSVLEGGSFSNIFLYQARKIVLDNSQTIQQSSGYTVTVKSDGTAGTASKKTIGFGIFINPAMYGANGAAGKPLDIEFKNGAKQINWIDNNGNFGGYYSTASLFVYLKSSVITGNYLFSNFMHANNAAKNGGPINAGILAMYLGKNATAPAVTLIGADGYGTEAKSLSDFPSWLQSIAQALVKTDFMANVWVPMHTECGADCAEKMAAERAATFGYEWFLTDRVN